MNSGTMCPLEKKIKVFSKLVTIEKTGCTSTYTVFTYRRGWLIQYRSFKRAFFCSPQSIGNLWIMQHICHTKPQGVSLMKIVGLYFSDRYRSATSLTGFSQHEEFGCKGTLKIINIGFRYNLVQHSKLQ